MTGAYSLATELLSEQKLIRAEPCVNCGWLGGEATIDTHHALDCSPELRRITRPAHLSSRRVRHYPAWP